MAGTESIVRTGAPTFEGFFEAEYLRLSKAMFLLTQDHAEAEDLAQEAMARVFERWPRVQVMASPRAYAATIALNLWRRRGHRRIESGAAEPALDDLAPGVAERLDLTGVLRSLTSDQLEALVLVGWLGYSAAEAGRILRIDPASVRGRVHRARATIRLRTGENDG